MVPPTDPWYEDLTGVAPFDLAKSKALLAQASKLNQLENFSVSFPGQDMHLEVNDEIVLRYLALYVKTYKLVHPIVVAAVGMWNAVQSLIKSDCDELVAFVFKRKE